MGPSSLRHEGGSRAKKRTIHAENGSCFNKRRINTWTTAAATTTRLPISICGVLVIFVILVSCQLRIVETSSINVNNLNRDFDRVATAAGGGEQDGEVAEETDSFDDDNDDLQLNLIGNGAGLEEQDQDRQHYTHQWAVHIVGGKSVADRIARKHGFINGGEIFPDYYHLVHRKVAKRSLDAHAQVHGRLIREPTVRWAEQQKVKRRSKRDFLQLSLPTGSGGRGGGERGKSRSARRSKTFNFNDPRWIGQWYLNRGAGLDMNVIEAWNEGITGKGIVVTILDDGLEHDHPDIKSNFDPMASFDVNSLDMDPMPTYDLTDSNRHGTRCAGEVAAEANNSICAVGIAFEANIGGVRMLDGDVTDAVEARSLSHNPQHIDIYSASWGPDDDGKTVDGPGELATRAFMEGVAKGRNGKGSIFVWASGNGGRDHDNCNCDGYTNSIWTLSISSATENGLVPWYSEACSSTLATTYSSGGTGEKQIITIDLHHSCTQSHTGTSASAPLAAGICALALQANTNLTWRDMQHIVVRTARPNNLIAPDWSTNGVGLNVSHSFGYGLMDAGAMVKLSRKWKPVPEQNKCEIKAKQLDKNIPAKSKVTLELKVTDCPGVRFLEHVQAKVTLMSGRRGDLQIYLVSPSGTRSVLLAHRRHDLNRSGFTDWPFMTVHSWGETPLGKWTLEIHNEGRYTDHKNGKLQTWSLIAHGIEGNPNDPEEKANGNVSKSTDTGSKRPTSDNDASSSTNISSSKPPANDDFDGSDNSIAVPLNHVHNSPLPANSEMAADSSLSILSTSVASSPSSSACAKMSDQNGKCLECSLGLALFNGICQPSCPDGYVSQGHSREDVGPAALLTYICVQCHYTCKTCIGPSAYECRTCYEDSSLANVENFGQLCYTSQWLSYMSEAVIWFKLLIGSLVVNVIVIIILIYCICSRRNNRASGIVGRTHSTGESQRQWERDNQIYTRISPDDNNLSEDEFENLEIESETEEFSTNDVEMRIGKKFLVAEETKHDDGLLIKNKNYKANIKTFKVALSPSQIVSNVSSKTISEDSIKLVKDDDENS